MNYSHARRQGFTLLELALAIGLSATVMYLLTTAIELYLVRDDRNRVRTESAQVARAVLDQIARDVRSLKTTPMAISEQRGGRSAGAAGSAGSNDAGSGGASNSGVDGGASSSGSSASTSASSAAGGNGSSASGGNSLSTTARQPARLSGQQRELRLDCAAAPAWTRWVAEVEPGQAAAASSLPGTVRYYVADGEIHSSQRVAARGVEAEFRSDMTGLVREFLPAVGLLAEGAATAVAPLSDASQLELLAPEVVEATFAYFDGTKMVESWDPAMQSGPPRGVEIRIKVLQTSYEQALQPETQTRYREGRYAEREVVEYRRFVSLLPAPKTRSASLVTFRSQGDAADGATRPPGGKSSDSGSNEENQEGAAAPGDSSAGASDG